MSERGFSLLEVMVAIAILITGLFAVVTLLLQSIKTGKVTTDRTIAISLTEDALEGIRADIASSYLNGDPFVYFMNGSGEDCDDINDCIYGYESACITNSCDGFEVAPGCEESQKFQKYTSGVGNRGVYYHKNIGYFQMDGTSNCEGSQTQFLRKVHSIPDTMSNSVEVCVETSYNNDTSMYQVCEVFTDPRAGG